MRHLHPKLIPLALLLSLAGACAAYVDPDADAEDIGAIGDGSGKEDEITVREVAIDLGAEEVKRFRVTAHRFHATLVQDGTEPAMLSAKHYDIEIESAQAHQPELDAAAPAGEPEESRNWTLRVHNLGAARLTGMLRIEAVTALPEGDGEGGVLRETDVTIAAGAVQRFRVSGPSISASLVTEPAVEARISAKHYEIEAASEPGTAPTLEVVSPNDELRNWTIRVENLGAETLRGRLTVRLLESAPPTPEPTGLPTRTDPIQYENEWCTYGDTIPYVLSVKWDHPLVQQAMARMAGGYRSMFAYTEWRVPYGLENDREGTDQERSWKRARNFMRVLCGEHRDYPEMLGQKLESIVSGFGYGGPNEVASFDTSENLFTQLSYPAYVRMVDTMRIVWDYKKRQTETANDGFHYGFGEHGHGSRRVDNAPAPWTHCEMKFMFTHYMTASSPSGVDGATYMSEYEAYRASECTPEDLAWMYNFRGHVNFQPLWLESNAFNMNARRARGVESARNDRAYYLHPFADRYARARAAWGTYLFYPETDHAELIRASESGGGPILYITDQDLDNDGLADYRLFDENGCGDQGVGLAIPSQNCNMVSWEKAYFTRSTTGHVSTWQPAWASEPDMGFFRAFGSFEERMARFNQALDRHTNWGPTGYYMIDASDVGDRSPRFYGAYSPIVAASYDVSASDFFIRRDYETTDAFERGRAKWLFVMRFPAERYYDMQAMREGRAISFDENYFSEPSLSNDFYNERALDHWGYIPGAEHHAEIYLTYGHAGTEPPEPAPVPAP
jgi:hypothetical protein